MNDHRYKHTYRYVFAAKCPSDDDTIIYGLEIRSNDMIRVEAIKEACANWTSGFQEQIAEALHHEFPATSLQLRAQHQGVEIVTVLKPAPQTTREPSPDNFPEGSGMWLDQTVRGMAGTPGY